jgi:protein O-mannosyl-transferase
MPIISWQRSAPYLFLIIATFAVYSNIYDNVMLFDDDLIIRLNTYLRSWDTLDQLLTSSTTAGAHIAGGFYRPVQTLLYFFIYQISGEQPFFYHLLNVLLHAANAGLGYRFALRLGLDPRAALLGMLIWTLHPLHTEAVTYMSGTADPLFVFFMLWGLNILFPEMTQRRIWLCVLLFVLAILSKETAVVFPALVCVCLYYASERRLKIKTYAATWPLWLIAFAFLAWRVSSPDFDGPERYANLYNMPEYATLKHYSEDPISRFATFFATLPAYAVLLVWPVGLHMERAFPLQDDLLAPLVLVGIAMVLAATVWIVKTRDKPKQALSFGLLWFAVAHAPDTGILFPMNSLFLEHWMYLPALGLFLGLAKWVVENLERLKQPFLTYSALGLAFASIVALSARTYDQNKLWHDPIVFYNNIFAYGVTSPRAHNNLAIAYTNAHDLPKAIEEYRRAIKEGDTYAETHYNLALALLSLPDPQAQVPQAIIELERSIEIEPRFYRSYLTLAELYARTGDAAKAAAYRRKAQDILGHQ